MVFRLPGRNFRNNAKKKEVVNDKTITERQNLEHILDNENANTEIICVRYEYEPATELAPALNKNLRTDSTMRADSTKSMTNNGIIDSINKDRFTLGLVSGLTAGVAMTLLNYIFIYTTPAHNLFADFVGIMLLGSQPNTLGETITATGGHLFLGGFLGIIFSYLLLLISEKYLIIKGITYGTIIFFSLFSLGVLFKITGLEFTPLHTVITKSIGSAFYGFVLAYTLQFLTKRK